MWGRGRRCVRGSAQNRCPSYPVIFPALPFTTDSIYNLSRGADFVATPLLRCVTNVKEKKCEKLKHFIFYACIALGKLSLYSAEGDGLMFLVKVAALSTSRPSFSQFAYLYIPLIQASLQEPGRQVPGAEYLSLGYILPSRQPDITVVCYSPVFRSRADLSLHQISQYSYTAMQITNFRNRLTDPSQK